MIKVFYHIYCVPGVTDAIVHDQLTKLVFSGVYRTADHIYVGLVGPDDATLDVLEDRLKMFGHKIQVIARGVGDQTYERFTFRAMLTQGLVKPDDKILYMHSKGVTRTAHEHEKHVVWMWRTFMEYEMFTRHLECIRLLDAWDTVGVNYRSEPAPHYSGNLWWARGDYFLSLDPAMLDAVHPGCDCNHISPELWIGTGTVTKRGMCTELSSYQVPCYQRVCLMSEYMDL